MTTNHTTKSLRDYIAEDCHKLLAALKYTDHAMILYGIRQLLETKPTTLPDGIVIENEKDEATLGGLMRISPASLPYIWDMRRGILYERWCDEAIKCPVNNAHSEFKCLWKDASAWSAFLKETYIANVPNSASRFVAVLLHVVPLLPQSEEYLEVTWAWLQEIISTPKGSKARLVTMGKDELIVALCRACRDRDVVSSNTIDEILSASGLSQVRAQLAQDNPLSFKTGGVSHEDDMITPLVAAKSIGLSPGTLNNKKSAGEIPKNCYVERPGRRIMYCRGELLRWHMGLL